LIDVQEAFRKFRSRLELTQREQADASRRQQEIRQVLAREFKREHDFLTGSYKRHTKTKPLKDVDIFFVLHADERHYRDKPPSMGLADFERVLADEYGSACVSRQHRSVCVHFDIAGEEERVMSFDVVPAFAKGNHYEIPDTTAPDGWIETDPRVHEELAQKAHADFNDEWKGMVRMAKKWNEVRGKPLRPSFLIEVMALDLLRPPFGGDYPFEFKSFFASMAERVYDEWPDPAGLGPAVSDGMSRAEKAEAARALEAASEHARHAIRLAREGRNGDALRIWRDEVFGDWFPLS